MMMFRLWQNALLEKVSPAQLLQPQDAHPPRMFFLLGWGSTGVIALAVTLACSKEAHASPGSGSPPGSR